MKTLLNYSTSILYFVCFGFLLSFFHIIQWIGFYTIGKKAQKAAVDILNFFLLKCLLIVGSKISFENPFILPKDRSIIFIANHQSTYDVPPIIWHFRKHNAKFVSKKELGKGIPSISFNLRHGGSVLIDRKNQKKALIGQESIWMKNWKQQSKHGSKNTEKTRTNTKTFSMLKQLTTQNH